MVRPSLWLGCLGALLIPLAGGAGESTLQKTYQRRASPMMISPQSPIATTTYANVQRATASHSQNTALQLAAYQPILSPFKLNGTLPGIRSDNGRLTVGYRFTEGADKGLSRPLHARERQIVKEVLQQLSGIISLKFVESPAGYLAVSAGAIAGAGIGGFTNLPEPHSAQMMGGQIVLDRSFCKAESHASSCENLRRIIRHELGHALGLQHPWEAGAQYEKMRSIMSYEPYADYQPSDIAALQHLYGTAQGSRMIADAQALAAERATVDYVWNEMTANPAAALKAMLSQTEPAAPPTPPKGSFTIDSEAEGATEQEGVISSVLKSIFGQ